MKRDPGKEIARHLIRLGKVIPVCSVKVRCVQLLMIIQRLWKVPTRGAKRRERRMVGKRIIHILM
jgi:hypothetical protein